MEFATKLCDYGGGGLKFQVGDTNKEWMGNMVSQLGKVENGCLGCVVICSQRWKTKCYKGIFSNERMMWEIWSDCSWTAC